MDANSPASSGTASTASTVASTMSSSNTLLYWVYKGWTRFFCSFKWWSWIFWFRYWLIRPLIFLRGFPYVVYIFVPAFYGCMLWWAYFGALVFWYACDISRLWYHLFAWLHSYFRLNIHLRVWTISVFSARSWTCRNLLGLFINRWELFGSVWLWFGVVFWLSDGLIVYNAEFPVKLYCIMC